MTPHRLIARLSGITALALLTLPASAQNLKLTLTNVTFNDGAAATGYIDYNPTTNVISNYDFQTTDGTSDGLLGSEYSSSAGTFSIPFSNSALFFNNPNSLLVFTCNSNPITGPGTFKLDPGSIDTSGSFLFNDSGEVTSFVGSEAQNTRVISGGEFVATLLPVPEASTVVTFAFLLSGGVIFLRRRRISVAN